MSEPTKALESPAPRRRRRTRAQTENELLDAALRLLRRAGVLSGVQLREVAAEAGINHGQIYSYFGNKRDLFRAALSREVQARFPGTADHWRLPFAERRRAYFDWALKQGDILQLQALLLLDDDPQFRMFHRIADTLESLARDRAAGDIAEDVDVVAAHVFTSAAVFGYAMVREKGASELGLSVEELDARVAREFDKMLGQFQDPRTDTP